MSQKSKDAAAKRKKSLSFGDLSNQSKKNVKRGAGPGASLKNLKVPPFVFRHRHHNIYSPGFIYVRERRRRRRPRLCVGRARVGETLPRTQPPRVFFRGSFARARAEERERERKSARRFKINLRKKKEEKRGVTKRRVEVRILASLAHHE